MNTAVGYLNSACKFGSSSTFNNQQEVVAQKKVAALAAIRDYLCTINQQFNPTNLKGEIYTYFISFKKKDKSFFLS